MKLCKCTKSLLALALALILLGSCLASLFHTSFGSVKVERISFDGGNGTLSGILYMPKEASSSWLWTSMTTVTPLCAVTSTPTPASSACGCPSGSTP